MRQDSGNATGRDGHGDRPENALPRWDSWAPARRRLPEGPINPVSLDLPVFKDNLQICLSMWKLRIFVQHSVAKSLLQNQNNIQEQHTGRQAGFGFLCALLFHADSVIISFLLSNSSKAGGESYGGNHRV